MHLTDDQLNEYLDEATTERAQIEAHLSSCDECAARLSTLQNVFTELDSLPELELTRDPRRAVHSPPEPASPTTKIPHADSDSASRRRVDSDHPRRAIHCPTHSCLGNIIIKQCLHSTPNSMDNMARHAVAISISNFTCLYI